MAFAYTKPAHILMIDESLWRVRGVPRLPSTPPPTQVDVAIVGGGITGLTAAYLLKQSGKRVAVFEREQIGSGETGNTSAHLTHVTDAGLAQIAKQFGREAARRVWKGGAAAIDLIEANARERGIACGFQRVPGFQCAPFFEEDTGTDALREDADLANQLGFHARFTERGPITGKPAIAFSDQAIFHPLDYLTGLALAVDGDGSFVRVKCEVSEVLDDPLAVIVNGETVACDDVILATHVPLAGRTNIVSATLFQTKLYPYSSYVLGAQLHDDQLMPGLYFDSADPYYYLRVHDDGRGRYAIFGGEDHKTGQESDTESRFERLVDAFKRLIPTATVERRWSGQVIETSDGLPFIGETAAHQFAATGYAGNGMTFGTLAGMMLHDEVMKRSNPWREIFDPHRKAASAGALATFISENVDYPWYFIADRIRHPDAGGEGSVGRGEGRVVEIDGKRVAIHRTNAGEVLKVSAVCTHMGCLVRWNGAERTWDCPCHGSRFAPDGLVLGGPAEAALEKIE